MTRNCPGCGTNMQPQTFHGFVLDICTNCAGIWFEADELRQLLKSDRDALKEIDVVAAQNVKHGPAGISTYSCPNDLTRLNEYHYEYSSPAILHTCSQCGGFWVAESDLKLMNDSLTANRQPLSANEQAAIIMAQAEAEHIREMDRLNMVTTLFGALTWPMRPRWGGFYY